MDSSSEKEQEGEEKGKEEGEEKNLLQRREGKEEMRKTLACLQNLPSHGNLLEYNPLEETPQRCFVGLAKDWTSIDCDNTNPALRALRSDKKIVGKGVTTAKQRKISTQPLTPSKIRQKNNELDVFGVWGKVKNTEEKPKEVMSRDREGKKESSTRKEKSEKKEIEETEGKKGKKEIERREKEKEKEKREEKVKEPEKRGKRSDQNVREKDREKTVESAPVVATSKRKREERTHQLSSTVPERRGIMDSPSQKRQKSSENGRDIFSCLPNSVFSFTPSNSVSSPSSSSPSSTSSTSTEDLTKVLVESNKSKPSPNVSRFQSDRQRTPSARRSPFSAAPSPSLPPSVSLETLATITSKEKQKKGLK